MFCLIERMEKQDMSQLFITWHNNRNRRMMKQKSWKDLWEDGMLLTLLSGNWTVDYKNNGLYTMSMFIQTISNWELCYNAWESWWEHHSKLDMPSITLLEKQAINNEFALLKIQANDLEIMEFMTNTLSF